MNLTDAIVATADPAQWRRYCEANAELAGRPLEALDEYGRGRLRQLMSPDGQRLLEMTVRTAERRGQDPAPLIVEIELLHSSLVNAFRDAVGCGRARVSGYVGPIKHELDKQLLDNLRRLDLFGDQIELADGTLVHSVVATMKSPSESAPAFGGVNDEELAQLIETTFPSTMPGITAAEKVLRPIIRQRFGAPAGNTQLRTMLERPEFSAKRRPTGRPLGRP